VAAVERRAEVTLTYFSLLVNWASQREERLDVLTQRMLEQHLKPDDYWWYLDHRRFGTVPHAGFGLGLERAVQFITGLGNIRDVIPFPRTPGSADF
jgi:asparaginyl-tRNA synthetase